MPHKQTLLLCNFSIFNLSLKIQEFSPHTFLITVEFYYLRKALNLFLQYDYKKNVLKLLNCFLAYPFFTYYLFT